VRGRRGPIPSRGGAWRPRNPAKIATTLLDAKRQQMEANAAAGEPTKHADEIDAQQPADAPVEASAPSRRSVLTKFRLMAFPDSEDSEESDYEPSEDSEEVDGASVEELLERFEEEEETAESEELEEDADSRWWKSSEDKRRWEKRYRQADAAFRKRFGCAIDTPALPETRRRLRKEKTRHRAYKLVLAGLVIAFLVQLVVVYATSSWAFSMVAWQSSTAEKESSGDGVGETPTSMDGGRHRVASLKPTGPPSQHEVPEHVRTGLHLCSTLSRRVLHTEHDVTATQHAVRACDIAVKFAPPRSRQAIEAHALRGDLRSLLSRFDSADEDYKAAMTLVLEVESSAYATLAPGLSQALELKLTANRWTQLYKAKSFKDLRREAKARAADAESPGGSTGSEVGELAADWLRAFKGKKAVLEVLTFQRSWTLRRLKYEVVDDDNPKPDVV
jgi:hypothetical protein